ncbi:MAG: DUF5309 family protein [Muribaculaceae bacterium]|nr:DUF5309 family protein [Muribaculaceae bacterium]
MKKLLKSVKNAWKAVKKTAKWVQNHRPLVLIVVITLLLMLLCGCIGGSCGAALAMAAVVVPGVEGGKHVVDGPLTTDLTREEAPELLLNEIDREIVKIRPMATPIDQLSRHAGAKHSGSMVVDYYNVDTKPTSAKTVKLYDEDDVPDPCRPKLYTEQDRIFDVSDTILVKGMKGYEADGKTESDHELVLYVIGRDDVGGGIIVEAVNGKNTETLTNIVPTIQEGTVLIRMGRAATELDVMSPQFEALPQKAQNFCQIFKMQIEQSTLQRLSNKEVGWSLNDQEEAAVYDMRLGMEKSFLFGKKARVWDPVKKESIMLTGGIWSQAGKEFAYDTFSSDVIVDLMRTAFTGNAGSKRKVLIGGSGLISALNKQDYTKVITAGESVAKWGIDFTELRSKFGTLYVLMSEVFDECGRSDDGIIIDPDYLQKYVHLPFSTESLNLKASGVRNVDATVLTEASCLVLRYPKAHVRVVKREE